jgi:hypothetical protein
MAWPPWPPETTTGVSRAPESARERPCRWYVRPALSLRRTHGRAAIAVAGLAVLAGCGGERQDENEPSGEFPVEVLGATFPEDQKLAQSSNLVITVRNAGDETIPNIGVTVDGFNYRKKDVADLADPERPVFAINGMPVQIAGFPESKDDAARGCDTAYVNTWACGPLRPGREKRFRWSVTAVRAGRFKLDWRVNAGLDGNAKAVEAGVGDEPPTGSFSGTISRQAPDVRVADDGKTVVSGDR